MRIRQKIFIGYLALVAVAVVLVATYLLALADVSRRYEALMDSGQKVLLQAHYLSSAVQREVIAARTLQQVSDADIAAEYEQAVQDQKKAMDEMAPLLAQAEDMQYLTRVRSLSTRYNDVNHRIFDLVRIGQREAAQLITQKDGEPLRVELTSVCQDFVEEKTKTVAVNESMLAAHVNDLSGRLLLGAGVGILTSLLAATLLTEGLTSPLRRLMRNIQGITGGDLKTTVVVHSRDEIGELAQVLETMRQRLDTAAGQNEELLTSAREEAEKLFQTRSQLETANADLAAALANESEIRKRSEEISRLKDEFTSMVSHELKTPVSYVYNYAAALKEHHASLNEGQRWEFLSSIQSEALHLLTLIDDIMAVSLLEAGGLKHRFVETDLRKLTDSVVKDQQLTTRRHTFTVKGPESLPVRADPTRLKQVLNNLLSNAIKYSPQGGPVEVRLRTNPVDGKAIIYVRDHGIGIRADDVPKLFDRFSRIQRRETMAIPGSGLGLYIAHHIIEAHGGTLRLEPAPGKGTIAEVTVPLMPAATVSGTDVVEDGKQDVSPDGVSAQEDAAMTVEVEAIPAAELVTAPDENAVLSTPGQ